MTSPYQERLESTLQQWLTRRSSRVELDYLAFLLAYTPASRDTEPVLDYSGIKRASWLALLQQNGNSQHAAVLDNYLVRGFLEDARWRTLLSDAGEAHLLANLLARVLRRTSEESLGSAPAGTVDLEMGNVARADLYAILRGWLAPEDLPEPITPRELAVHLFGGLWTELVYDEHPAGVSLDSVLENERPEFVSGRLDIDIVYVSEELPSLSIAP